MKIVILGAGQLGKMLAIDGYKLGHEFAFYGDIEKSPVTNLGIMFASKDKQAIKALNAFADIATFESENIKTETIQKINKYIKIRPGEKSLFNTQHRGREKQLLTKLNIPCAPYQLVRSLIELQNAAKNIGLPAILKTSTEGYDGKGQFIINKSQQLKEAWNSLNKTELILESLIKFKRELSLIAVRSYDDKYKYYPLVENTHHNAILTSTIAPATNISEKTKKTAKKYMQALLQELDHIGVLTIELFETDKELIVNEIAPRVHNSGHWSIEGAQTSQFENHIRAITNMPLGSAQLNYKYTTMLNIINNVGNTDIVLTTKNAHIHLYNKQPKINRKLGHITITANSKKELHTSLKKLQPFFKTT